MTKIEPRRSWVAADPSEINGEAEPNSTWAADRLTSIDVVALLGLVVLLAFLWGRGRHVWLWLDEGISVGISSHPFGDIPALLRQDGSPPLYYLLLHGWMRAFGTSEAATHVLSLLFALATVPAALWAGWSLFGRRAGWMAATLVAISPFIGKYANETRMYTLVALLALLTTATFLHAFAFRRRRHLPAFAVSLALLLYTHNWALFLALGAGAALAGLIALAPRDARRQLLLDGALAFGAAAVLYAPWVPSLAYQLAHTGAPFTLRPTLLDVREDLMDLFGGPEAVIVLGLGSGVAFMGVFRRPWSPRAVAMVAAIAIAGVAVAAGWALSRQNSVWVYRYLAVVIGPLLLILAAGLAEGGRTAVAALGLAVALVGPIAVKGQPYEKSNVKEVTTTMGSELRPGDLVIADFGRVPVLSQYLPPGLSFAETTGPVSDAFASDQRDATRRLEEGRPEMTLLPSLDALPSGNRVLVVCSAGTLALDATKFLRLIRQRCDEALALPANDSRFRLVAAVVAPPYGSNSPVNGHLFIKV
ncbi:MAG TPA: glycosyltransferase family 39 protein [Acidimicrobiales bacterium]|nr:glycosyltransferase family 39 protein [Acidimicrobiales bacterium]